MNNIVFGADLSTLTLNNNCLVKSNNNNQNVVNISYAINFESTNSYTSYPKYDSIGNDIGGQEAIDKRSIASLTTAPARAELTKISTTSTGTGMSDNFAYPI